MFLVTNHGMRSGVVVGGGALRQVLRGGDIGLLGATACTSTES